MLERQIPLLSWLKQLVFRYKLRKGSTRARAWACRGVRIGAFRPLNRRTSHSSNNLIFFPGYVKWTISQRQWRDSDVVQRQRHPDVRLWSMSVRLGIDPARRQLDVEGGETARARAACRLAAAGRFADWPRIDDNLRPCMDSAPAGRQAVNEDKLVSHKTTGSADDWSDLVRNSRRSNGQRWILFPQIIYPVVHTRT